MTRPWLVLLVLLFLIACSGEKSNEEKKEKTIDFLSEVRTTQQVDHSLQVIDSLEKAGVMAPPLSDYYRALVCDAGWRYRLAGYYYKRAFDAYEEPIHDWHGYAETGYRLACMQRNMQDYDVALRSAMSLVNKADSLEREGVTGFPRVTHAFFFLFIAECQLMNGQDEEAKRNSLKAYDVLVGDNTDDKPNEMILCSGLVEMFLKVGNLDEAEEWMKRLEEVHHEFEGQTNGNPHMEDLALEYKKCISLLRASILLERGKVTEAAVAYESVKDSAMMRHPANLESAVHYLMAAGRYDEAITFMNRIDTLSPASERPRMTFSVIRDRMIPRFDANMKAGHLKEALAIASDICQAIDTAMALQNKNDVSELSVIYETQQKDCALEQKEIEEKLHLIIIGSLALLLIVAVIAVWRVYKAKQSLHEKNRQLFDTIRQMERKEDEKQTFVIEDKSLSNESANHLLYRRLLELMRNNRPYTDCNLKREDLAQMLGTNYNYVADAIREFNDGQSLGDFLDDWRIKHAADLLRDTDEPVGLIIEESGFQSRSHFNTLFREKFKMTPSEYRIIAKENLFSPLKNNS